MDRSSEAMRTVLDSTPDVLPENAPQTNLGFLWDFWYPAMRSDDIYGKHLAKAMLLEVPLVLGRTSEHLTPATSLPALLAAGLWAGAGALAGWCVAAASRGATAVAIAAAALVSRSARSGKSRL